MRTFRGPAQAALLAGVIVSTGTIGCHHTAKKKARVERELTEHSQALTSGVVEALELQPEPKRDEHTALALELARVDQRIEGWPAEALPVTELLTNRTELEERRERIGKLLERRRELEERLMEHGAVWESERRAKQSRWSKWIGGGTLALGGLAALCIFVPASAPVIGRLLGWAAGKVPALASAMGVVSVKAFDAVVRGIEKARQSGGGMGGTTLLHNGSEPGGMAEKGLEAHLGREMDAEHKALVRARKAALKL